MLTPLRMPGNRLPPIRENSVVVSLRAWKSGTRAFFLVSRGKGAYVRAYVFDEIDEARLEHVTKRAACVRDHDSAYRARRRYTREENEREAENATLGGKTEVQGRRTDRRRNERMNER